MRAIAHIANELLRDPRLIDETFAMARRYLGVADG
jgi:hypothetical protein